jgi:hypothetical protein
MPEAEMYYEFGGGDAGNGSYYTADTAAPLMAPLAEEAYLAADEEMSYNAQAQTSQLRSASGGAADVKLERKIIRDASLSLKVDNFSRTYQQLNDLPTRFGGYVVSSDAYSYDGETMQRGSIMMRVDANLLKEALAEIETMGKVENQNTYSQDISMEYYDIAGRLSQYQTQEERLMDILVKAETVEDLVAVERELTRVRAELESLKGQIRYYDQMTTLSSINVSLYQPDKNTQTVQLSGWAGLWQDIYEGFIRGINGLISGAASLLVGLARLLPLLLLLALVVVVLVVVLRGRRR